jgi:SAM-dependent methyltransferase
VPASRRFLIGRDLGEALDGAIPADSSGQSLADDYIGRFARGELGVPAAGARVMDLGAGEGGSVDQFRAAAPGCRWVGVDIADSVESRARTRRDAEFVIYDGVHLPFADASFDLVYCKQVLEHAAHPAPLLADVARVLAPGGVLAGSTSQLEAFHSRSRFNYTPFGLAEVLREAGLDVEEVRPGVDGFTLLLRRAVGTPRWLDRAWATETPVNRAIGWVGRARRADHVAINTAKLVFCGQFSFLARRPAAPG